tara:strand:- start:633 stop:764 length:132 start_codon:yes stop_codon:yes gene_type:complete
MWWCCGQRNLNAKGCKTQKHTTNEDKDENIYDEDENQPLAMRC